MSPDAIAIIVALIIVIALGIVSAVSPKARGYALAAIGVVAALLAALLTVRGRQRGDHRKAQAGRDLVDARDGRQQAAQNVAAELQKRADEQAAAHAAAVDDVAAVDEARPSRKPTRIGT